jgi:hypothetical protein
MTNFMDKKVFVVCVDVVFLVKMSIFRHFSAFFRPLKKTSKMAKNGSPGCYSGCIKILMTNILVRSINSSAYVHLDYFVSYV